MIYVFLYLLGVLAIEHITAIFTSVDLLDGMRKWLSGKQGRLGRIVYKIATCQFCESFWLCLIFGFWFPIDPFLVIGQYDFAFLSKWILVWFSAHALIVMLSEFKTRYLNRAPFSVVFSGRIKNES